MSNLSPGLGFCIAGSWANTELLTPCTGKSMGLKGAVSKENGYKNFFFVEFLTTEDQAGYYDKDIDDNDTNRSYRLNRSN